MHRNLREKNAAAASAAVANVERRRWPPMWFPVTSRFEILIAKREYTKRLPLSKSIAPALLLSQASIFNVGPDTAVLDKFLVCACREAAFLFTADTFPRSTRATTQLPRMPRGRHRWRCRFPYLSTLRSGREQSPLFSQIAHETLCKLDG